MRHVLCLLKASTKRPELSQQQVFLSPALTKEDVIKEGLCLRKRRELLEQGIPGIKPKLRNFTNEVKVNLEVNLDDNEESQHTWLSRLNLLQKNARSLVRFECRFKLASIVAINNHSIICICETWLNETLSDSELLLNSYLIFGVDRSSNDMRNHHGGALIAIKSPSVVVIQNYPI